MLPEPSNIPQRAIDRGKKILAEAPNHNAEWVDDQVALMMKEEFGLAIYSPKPMPTAPSGYNEFLQLSTQEQLEKTDPDAMRCKAYMFNKHRVEMDNETMRRTLKDQLIPAFTRMKMFAEVTICQGLLKEYDEMRGYVPTMSFDEMERRYGQ
jgi:hypothetical protein